MHRATRLPLLLGGSTPELADRTFLAANGVRIALAGAPSLLRLHQGGVRHAQISQRGRGTLRPQRPGGVGGAAEHRHAARTITSAGNATTCANTSRVRAHGARIVPGGFAMSGPLRVVHYLNQFFGGIGGEDQAHVGVTVRAGAVGPGPRPREGAGRRRSRRGHHHLRRQLRQRARGGRRARDRAPRSTGSSPTCSSPGPAFASGRYGLACALACKVAQGRGIPAITAMHPENPGASSARRGIYIVPTGRVDDVHAGRARRAGAAGAAPGAGARRWGRPRWRATCRSGMRRVHDRGRPGYQRALDMLLDKLHGRPLPVGSARTRARAGDARAAHRRSLARPHRHGDDRRPRAQGQSRQAGVGQRRALLPAHGGRARVALADASGRPITPATSTTSSTATRTTSCRSLSCAIWSAGRDRRCTSTSTRCPA